jgi:integrase
VSVYKRGDVYWYEFTLNGTRIRQSAGTSNRAAALRVETQKKHELWALGAGFVRVRIGFRAAMDEFLAWSKSQNKPATRKRYGVSSTPLNAFFGNKKLQDIRRADIEAFKLERMQQCSNAGTNRDLACLRVMLNWAMVQGYIQANLFKGVKMLPEGPGNMRIVSHEEERQYLENADPLTRDLATIIVETGMRPNEVYCMRSENVHLEEKFVFIPDGKTKTARRNVPLTEKAAEAIARRMKAGYLFPHRLDPAKPMIYSHGHTKVSKRLGVAFRLYDFRHTFGSRMAMAGVDLMTLRELMGHASITTTQRYCHPTPQHKREAVEKLVQFNDAHFPASRPAAPARTCRRGREYPQKSPQWVPMRGNGKSRREAVSD